MVARKAQDADAQAAEQAETLGVKLRSARESQELSIEAVEAELRIGAEFLEALESDRFDLKQYGARLGLNVPELLAEYDSAAGNRNVDIRPLTEFRLRDKRSSAPWIVAGIVLLVVAASVLWWFTLGAGSNQIS
jgi:cytoskeletal protein RodZ